MTAPGSTEELVVIRDIRPSILKRWVSEAEYIGYEIVDTVQTLKQPMWPARRALEADFALGQLRRVQDELSELIHKMESTLHPSAMEKAS